MVQDKTLPPATINTSIVDTSEEKSDPRIGEIGAIGINIPMAFTTDGSETLDVSAIEEATLEQLVRMVRIDGQAQGLLNLLKLPLVAAPHELRERDAKSINIAEFVGQNLFEPPTMGGMTTTFRYVKSDMAMATLTGFRAYERVWELRNGGWAVLRKIAPRNPLTIKIKQDRTGGFAGFVQRIPGDPIERNIPVNKALLYTRNKEDNPLYGRSDFLAAFYHFDKLHKLYYIAHIAFQLEAIPVRIGVFPKNADKQDKLDFQKAIARLGFDTSMTMPEGFELEAFGTNQPGKDMTGLIKHHKEQMSVSFLASFLDHAGGSLARSKVDRNIFADSVQAMLMDMDDHVNNWVIPDLVRYNFASFKFPTLRHKPLDNDKKDVLREIFVKLMASPNEHSTPEFMLAVEEQLSRDLGFAIDYNAIREERLKELVANKMAKEQEAAGAVKQLAETFTFDTESGEVRATDKTYEVLQNLKLEKEAMVISALRHMGEGLTKRLDGLSETQKTPPLATPPTQVHVSLGDHLEASRDEARSNTEALVGAVTKLAEAEASRPINVNVEVKEGAIKAETHIAGKGKTKTKRTSTITLDDGSVAHKEETEEEVDADN